MLNAVSQMTATYGSKQIRNMAVGIFLSHNVIFKRFLELIELNNQNYNNNNVKERNRQVQFLTTEHCADCMV